MSKHLGDFANDSTIRILFNTTTSAGVPVAPSSAFVAADFRVYKNNGTAEKTTANGITVAAAFDGVTGCQSVVIDTSDDTGDANFWVTGADYALMLKTAKTVDGKSVDGLILRTWSIENRYMRGTNNANTATPLTTEQTAQAVWNAILADPWVADGFGVYFQNLIANSAIAIEAAILNEGDATALLAAIAAKVETFLINDGDATATMAAIATAVRTNLATELARIDVNVSSRNAIAPLNSTQTQAAAQAAITASALGTLANQSTIITALASFTPAGVTLQVVNPAPIYLTVGT